MLSFFLRSWLLSLVLINTAAQAANISLEEQRQHYLKAKDALDKNNNAQFKLHYAQLGGYPLVEYLDYLRLRDQLSDLPFIEIDKFLNTYRGSLLADRLQQNLLSILAARKKWSDFQRYYSSEFTSTEMQCNRVYADVFAGKPEALEETAKLWDVGQEQPDACNALFKRWRNEGKLTQDLVWSRFQKALQNNKLSLANQITPLMVEPYTTYAKAFIKVDARPDLIKNHTTFQEQKLPIQHIIAHGITKLAKKDAMGALKHWERYEAQQMFGDDMSRSTKLQILKALVKQGHAQEAQKFINQSYALRETSLVEELLRVSLENLDWPRVNEGIQMLSTQMQNSERWQYWRARAQDELKSELPGFQPSAQVYTNLAEKRGFYGFLAADILRKQYTLEDKSKPVDPASLIRVSQLDGMLRSRELFELGYENESRAEWMHTTRKMNNDDLYAAGHLAKQWGWYTTGIQTMMKGNLWDNLTARFPLAYESEVKRISKAADITPTLVYAITRQESAFDADAKSRVGALGLMQLMPATAEEVAKKKGIKHKTQDLLNPSHNIFLGSQYLNGLLQRFDGNRILAAAAYNAGPGRVREWLSESRQERPFDVWIETIPFNETRNYVQNILSFSVIYGYRLGQPQTLVSQLEANQRL